MVSAEITTPIDWDRARQIEARDLRSGDIGLLIAIQTDAAVYVGHLWKISFYDGGQTFLTVKRNDTSAECTVLPSTIVKMTDIRDEGIRYGR